MTAPLILQFTPNTVGLQGYVPRRVKLQTTATYAQLTAAGFLNSSNAPGILATDILEVIYNFNQASGVGTYGSFIPNISAGVITLVEASEGEVPFIVLGNIQAGISGTAGTLSSFPATASKGSLVIAGVANTGNTVTTISNSAMGQTSTLSIPDPGAATGNFILNKSSVSTQGIAGNLTLNSNPVAVCNVVTAGQAALASAGKVNVFVAPTPTAQITILDIKVLKSTGLSGNSGDRLLVLGDGTTVFNNAGITAAVLGTPIFTIWGGTGNPITASGTISSSAAGANVYLQYSGGSADYNAGSVIIAVTYAQITA